MGVLILLAVAKTIAFLGTADVTADGNLSPSERALKAHSFPVERRFDNPDVPTPRIEWRMAATPSHLYLSIHTDADAVSYHEAGYLWGDGYRLMLALPDGRGRTGEYVDLFVDPRAPGDPRTELFLATRNGEQVYKRLGEHSSVAEAAINGGTLFEAAIAWRDIEPFHPLVTPKIGLNIYFAKGFETKNAGYFPYGYALINDEAIWDEEYTTREFVGAEIEAERTEPLALIRPSYLGVPEGEPLSLDVFSQRRRRGRLLYDIRLEGEQGEVWSASGRVRLAAGRTRSVITPDFGKPFPVGRYAMTLGYGAARYETDFTVFPRLDPRAEAERLYGMKDRVPKGTLETAAFHLEQGEAAFETVRPYEDHGPILNAFTTYRNIADAAAEGDDALAAPTGVARRAFRSGLDGELQPYSVRLPEDYDPQADYPGLVFLHGSGQGEETILDQSWSDGTFVELAPYGRDETRAYAYKASQIDIVEAVEAASAAYPIDEGRLIIGGFSMGGYGALRAFYENPSLYKGVAVLAGHPNLASEWLGEPHPNFLMAEDLLSFKGVPVFIYHGRKDPSLPVTLAEKLAERLTEAGAEVTLHIDDEAAHVYPNPRIYAQFQAWLREVADE